MPKEKLLTDKDIQELFNGPGWAARVAKRNKAWATARDRYGRSFGQMALERVGDGAAIPSAGKPGVAGMVEELAREGYAWSKEDAQPMSIVLGEMEDGPAKAWIGLVEALRGNGIKIGKAEIKKAARAFESTQNDALWDFLVSEGADDWKRLLNRAHLLSVEPMDFFDNTELGKMIGAAIAGLAPPGIPGFGAESDEERKSAEASAKALERAVRERDLDAGQVADLVTHLSPPQQRLEEFAEKNGSNLFELIERSFKESSRPREWFAPNQLLVLDAIEEKHGMGRIAPKAAPKPKKSAKARV